MPKSKLVIFLLCIAFVSCCKPNDETLTGSNAIWCESIFLRNYAPGTHQKLTNEKLEQLATTLKKHNVKYAYLFAGPYGSDGHLPAYPFSDEAVNSVKILERYYPDIVILPWIGGVENRTVHLDDSIWVRNALDDTKKLVNRLSVPGVHVDLEFIKHGDPYLDTTISKEKPGDLDNYGNNVNSFHRNLRKILPGKFISSVVVATSPDTKPWKRKTSIKELTELSKYIDQLSFLYYDTSITDQVEYEKNCLDLLKDIQLLKKQHNIQCLVSIGTFINVPDLQKYRNMNVENVPNALQTIQKCLNELKPAKSVINGISIFCNWETDQLEWEQIDKNRILLP